MPPSFLLLILIRWEKQSGKTKDNKVEYQERRHHSTNTSQRVHKPIRNLVLMGNTHILLNLPICTYKPEGNTRNAEYSSYPKFQFVFLLLVVVDYIKLYMYKLLHYLYQCFS